MFCSVNQKLFKKNKKNEKEWSKENIDLIKLKEKKIHEKVNEPNHINWKEINSTSQEYGRIRTKSLTHCLFVAKYFFFFRK